MERSDKQEQRKKKITEVNIFPVPFALGEIKENITIKTKTPSKSSQEQIINQAIKFHSQGNIEEAEKCYKYFIDQGFNDHRVFSNYGSILKSNGKLQEAEIATRKAIELNPNVFESHLNLGAILNDLGNLKEAELSTRKSIDLNPNLFNSHFLLGNILLRQQKLQEAEESIKKAIKLNPNHAKVFFTHGDILRGLGNLKEAELSIRKAIELKPNWAKAHEFLGLVHLENNKYESSLKCLSESANLLNLENKECNEKRYTLISQAKIKHDIEQFEYLASKGYETQKFENLANLYKQVKSEIKWPSYTQGITLSSKYQNLLKDSYNRIINLIDAPKLKKGAVNNSLNIDQISNDYFDHEFGLTYIDNFLSPLAIESLRKFLLESTIWFNIRKNGYLGAFLRDGFSNPLIIQIADELRKKCPRIFKDYPINNLWAFKYDNQPKNNISSLKGINVHADFAAINVNFWITPNESNLNPQSGGLIVYDVEAPKEWDFNTYNTDEQKIREELRKSKGNTRVIPYKENRAIVFNSNLFHETDKYEFKEGYENRRINVTLLFGKRINA